MGKSKCQSKKINITLNVSEIVMAIAHCLESQNKVKKRLSDLL